MWLDDITDYGQESDALGVADRQGSLVCLQSMSRQRGGDTNGATGTGTERLAR